MASNVFRISCVVALFGMAVGRVAVGEKPTAAVKPKSAVKLRITISKATTFFTEPVGKDGNIDYVTALNRHYSNGVTPQNNAAVPLLQAFGPKDLPEKLRPEFFKRLGMRPLPTHGTYYFHPDIGKGLKGRAKKKAHKQWDRQWDAASDSAWKRSQCPDIAKCLDANEKVLTLIEEASRRPRLFLPFIVEGKERRLVSTFGTGFGVYSAFRQSARLLSMRANLHLGEGRVDRAIEDLLTLHRLTRSCDRMGYTIASLVAYAMESIAQEGDALLAHSGLLTVEKAVAYRKQLDQLGPLNRFEGNYHIIERCYALDFFFLHGGDAVKDAQEWEDLEVFPKGTARELTGRFDTYFDANIVLKEMNRRIDEVVRVASLRDPATRRKEIRRLKRENRKLKRDSKRLPEFLKRGNFKETDREKASLWFSRAMVLLLLPGITDVLDAQDRVNSRYDLTRIALALAAYRADHRKYPAKLATLSPKFINKIPPDRFTGKPLKFQLIKSGYLLYSVGMNGQDDGGRRDESKADDIAVRTPKP